MLDAMGGYTEGENDRIKVIAQIIRTATTKLWNTQIIEEDRLTEEELWPFPWEKNNIQVEETDEEEKKRISDEQEKYLIKHFPDNGNSNK